MSKNKTVYFYYLTEITYYKTVETQIYAKFVKFYLVAYRDISKSEIKDYTALLL